LRVCCGLHPITSGELRLGGTVVNGISADRLARLGVCTVPEGRGIFANLTVHENLWLATATGSSLAHLEEAAYARFPILGQRRTQLAGTLSGGEQQMLALARSIGADPVLLILDELSMGLAPIIVSTMYETVAQLAAEGLSILVAEQFAAAVLPIAQSAAIMLHGRVVSVGTPAEIQEDLATAYLGG
jgi:branched-chain amino acid transport system ATP-binding protein